MKHHYQHIGYIFKLINNAQLQRFIIIICYELFVQFCTRDFLAHALPRSTRKRTLNHSFLSISNRLVFLIMPIYITPMLSFYAGS